jgi:hypothetical protein
MSRSLKSFADLSLKVIAVDTIDNRDVSLQFQASSPQATSPAATTPLEQLTERRRDLLADTNRWHHGGINE